MIKKEDLRQKLYEYFQDIKEVQTAYKMVMYEAEPTEENINRNTTSAKEKLKCYKDGRLELTEEDVKFYNRFRTKQGARKQIKEIYSALTDYEPVLYVFFGTETYQINTRAFLFGEPLTRETIEETDKDNEIFYTFWPQIFRYVYRSCFYHECGIDNEQFKGMMNAVIYTGAFLTFNSEEMQAYYKERNMENPILSRVEEIGEDVEQFKSLFALYEEINDRVEKLWDERIKILEERLGLEEDPGAENQEEKLKEEYKIVPSRLFYGDSFTIAETEIINVLTTRKFNPNYEIFRNSEDTINSLRHQDQEILNYIVLTLYANGIRTFTDRNIAVGMYKEKATETVSEVMLKEINDSIERIRAVKINEGFISAEKIGDIHAAVTVDDFLVSLRRLRYDHKEKANVYTFVGEPFFYDYAVKTGKINSYEKQIITRDIKGIQHNAKNDTLKQHLTRRVISLKYYKEVGVDVMEIYDILGISNNRDYTAARSRAEEMLKDLQKNYNFKYRFIKKGRTTTKLHIERYNDRPLEK